MRKQQLLILAIVYTVILAVLSLIKLGNLEGIGLPCKDKIFHFLAYGLLTLLWYLALLINRKLKDFMLVAILIIVYGMILELLQSKLTSYRDSSISDTLANTLGVLTMFLLIVIYKIKTHVKKI